MKWARVTFECSHCGAVFSDSASLKAHAARHSGRRMTVSEQGHVQSSVAFACSHCTAVFSNRWGLRAHLLRARRRRRDGIPAASGSKPAWRRYRSSSRAGAAPLAAEDHVDARVARRRHSRRPLARRLALAAAALLVVFLGVSSALAWWTTTASSSARITTGTWGSPHLRPGSSQATHYSSSGSAAAGHHRHARQAGQPLLRLRRRSVAQLDELVRRLPRDLVGPGLAERFVHAQRRDRALHRQCRLRRRHDRRRAEPKADPRRRRAARRARRRPLPAPTAAP